MIMRHPRSRPATIIVTVALAVACGTSAGDPVPTERPAAPVPREAADVARCAPIESSSVLLVGGRFRGKPVRVFIDTGAAGGAVSPAIAARLVAIPGRTLGYAGASGKVQTSAAFEVTGLELAGKSLTIAEAPIAVNADVTGFDFKIGVDQLAGVVADIDGRRRLLCLHDDAAGLDLAFRPMTFGVAGDPRTDIVVTAAVAGRSVDHMIVDTGAGISCLNEELVPAIAHTELDGVVSIDASGHRARQRVISVTRLCVGTVCAADHPLMVEPDMSALAGHPVRGILGMPFFAERRLVLDFPGRRLAIE
jgi:predicted aspartyl protease